MRLLIGLTGASGHPVAVEFLKRCPAEDKYLVASYWGERVLKEETGLELSALSAYVRRIFDDGDLLAPFSSGSTSWDAMVIVPCSVTTLGRIAGGIGDTLIARAAQVALKEKRRLVIALRESPLSGITLRNCLSLSREGAVIAPLSPPFYTKPCSLEDSIGDMADRLIRSLGYRAGKTWRDDELTNE